MNTYELQVDETLNVLRLSGRIDFAMMKALREEVLPRSFRDGMPLLVDMRAVSFVDSMGLGMFAALAKESVNHHAEVVLFGLSEPVRNSFEVTRMHQIFDILEHEAAARQWVA